MPVGMIFDSGQSHSGHAYGDAIKAAHLRGVPIEFARREMRQASGRRRKPRYLVPSLPFRTDTGDDVNENSIVVMLQYRGFRELFMGDAGDANESRLLAKSVFNDLGAAVIKVGHHGAGAKVQRADACGVITIGEQSALTMLPCAGY